jgi:hypothetical protein
MRLLDIIDPDDCDKDGVPLDWERCRTCKGGEVYIKTTSVGPSLSGSNCPTCGGHGSLRAAVLAEIVGLTPVAGVPWPYEAKPRCEGCGHPMSDGAWDGQWITTSPDYGDNNGWALAHLRLGDEPPREILGVPVCTNWSPCDEGCRHGGPGRMDGPGGPDGANVWMHFGPDVDAEAWARQAAPTIAAGIAVEASWRAVDVRTLGWPHDLRPEKLAVLCLRCWAERQGT